MRILVSDTMYSNTDIGQHAAQQIGEGIGEIVLNPFGHMLTSEEIEELWQDVDVIVAGTERYDAALLKKAPKSLKLIARNGVSFEKVDLKAAEQMKITITNLRGANAKAVADATMALILAVARKLPAVDRSVRDGRWIQWVADDLYGKTLGIIGFGAIGKQVAKRALGFDMKVLAYSPPNHFDQSYAAALGVQEADVNEILCKSDFVSLHLPVLPETVGMINSASLSLMKPSAYLINTSRGVLIKENDLIEALKNGIIQGAALDVYEEEPLGNSHLRMLDNVVLSPHCAGMTKNAIMEMARGNRENILAVMHNRECQNIVVGPF